MNVPTRRSRMLLFLLLIIALAGFVRWQAVKKLPVDYDELVYLPAAFRYQEMFSNGDWKQILDFEENMEHPPLNKLLFAVDLWLKQPQEPKWDELSVGRQIPDAALYIVCLRSLFFLLPIRFYGPVHL